VFEDFNVDSHFSFHFVDIYSEVVLTSSFGFGGELSIFDLIFLLILLLFEFHLCHGFFWFCSESL
jgi:hypothetical protein